MATKVWHVKIDSSNIAKAAYHFVKKDLKITFNNGNRYIYHDVKLSEFKDFCLAESHGKFLNAHIKPHKEVTQL